MKKPFSLRLFFVCAAVMPGAAGFARAAETKPEVQRLSETSEQRTAG